MHADARPQHPRHRDVLLVADGLGAHAEGLDGRVALAEDQGGAVVDDDGRDEGLQRGLVRDPHELLRHDDGRPVRVGRDHGQVDLAELPRRPAQVDGEGRERGARRARVGRARFDRDVEGAVFVCLPGLAFERKGFKAIPTLKQLRDGNGMGLLYSLFGDVVDSDQRDGQLAVSQDVLDDVLEGEIHLGEGSLDEV